MPYPLDMTKQHEESLFGLINFDNSGTIETDLTTAGYVLRSERAIDPAEQLGDGTLIDRAYGVIVENRSYAADFVEVYWNKVKLEDVMTMTSADGDFDFYDPDTWDDATSPAAAVLAFKAAATRAGIDPELAMENVVATRTHNTDENYYYLNIANTSYVFEGLALFKMPKHLSEVITQPNLNGFVFRPIEAGDVTA